MAKKSLKAGIFITFEGPEGCGKSTHSAMLCEYLKSRGYDCVHTREPGGTSLGEKIRELLLHSDGIKISDISELFLFEAARSQIVVEVIMPALEAGKIVICDRFSDATFSYQGYGGKVPLEVIRALDRVSTKGLKPRLTILLDVDTITGLSRAKRKGSDRMEKKDVTYHRRVRSGYLDLARRYHGRIKVIKAGGTIQKTQAMVRREVDRVI
ncbi:MAG: dTMP kinase [Candidatus Omnitrophica bacterium]|nr:dTMP kinase [Candidatus Omnitrophota bacterium]